MKASFLLLPAVLSLTGCVFSSHPAGPVQYSSESVDLDNSELVRVQLKMGAGELRVSDGASKLARADFAYNVDSWKPQVRYSHAGNRGTLQISQPDGNHQTFGNVKYSWDLQLNRKVPLDLDVNFGAGEARMDLSALDLRGVQINMGVGKADVDLRGKPMHSYNVVLHGGVGEATVRVSGDTPVYAEAHGGIGEIKVRGLQKEGGHWVTPSYEGSATPIRIEVHGGIGQINLLAD